MKNLELDRTYQEVKFQKMAMEYASHAAQNKSDLDHISSRFYDFLTANFDTPYQGNLFMECRAREQAFELIVRCAGRTTVNALIENAQKAYDFIVENQLFGYVYNPYLWF